MKSLKQFANESLNEQQKPNTTPAKGRKRKKIKDGAKKAAGKAGKFAKSLLTDETHY